MKKIIMITGILLSLCVGNSFATTYNDAVVAESPVYYWTFDETSGNAIEQKGGNVADELAHIGGATRAAGLTGLGSAAHVTPGSGLSAFYAADLSLTARPCNSWITEFWYKDTSPAGYSSQYLIDAEIGSYTNAPAIIFDFNGGSGDSEVEIYEKVNYTGRSAGLNITNPGQWNHIVMGTTQDSGNHAVAYVNGVQDADFDAVSAIAYFNYFERLAIGGHINYSTWSMNGMLDELAIYGPGDGLGEGGFEAKVADIAAHYSAVPEPATIALLGLGVLALRRRKK